YQTGEHTGGRENNIRKWGSGWKGTNFIVEIEETVTVSPISTDYLSSREDATSSEIRNATNIVHGPKIIVRTEEVLIVGLVLMLWVGAIALFFNRWVTRMSMGLVNNVNMPTCQFPAYNPTIYSKGFIGHNRPRQNSVFVGPSPNRFLIPRPPRKTRSAMDLHSMVLDESAEQV
ncbi:hypothetical protein GQX74_008155, partial [Glossina fuscipes]